MRSLTFDRIIGTGAMGTVYRATLHDGQGGHRVCAVKIIKSGAPDIEQFRVRMRDEARLLGMMRDERILGVTELLVVGGMDCVVMDFVDGIDLTDLVRENPMPAKAIAQLGAELAATLHRVHEAVHPSTGEPLRVIHRDIKPSNIMITREGSVRLLDFSVARAAFSSRESHTQGLVLGTLNYFPPEILAGGEPSTAVDLYGLGLTLWECATGKEWGTPQVHRHRFERRVEQRLSELGPTYEMVVPVLRQLLSWRPEDRPDGATAEKQLTSASMSSPGAPLLRFASEKVPPLIERKSASRAPDDRVGRTVPIDSAIDVRAQPASRKLERIDPLLLKPRSQGRLPTVTETFNDLAPPAAVVRSQKKPKPPEARQPEASNRAPLDPRADEASVTQVETEAIVRRPRSPVPDDLPLDPTTSEVPTAGGIPVSSRPQSAPALASSLGAILAETSRDNDPSVSATPTLIHAESMVRPARTRSTPAPAPKPSLDATLQPERAPERPRAAPPSLPEPPRGPSMASTAALLLAASLFGAVIGVSVLLAILFVGWAFTR